MRSIRTILHPTDFSPASEPAAELATELAAKFGAELTFLYVYTIHISVGPLVESYPLPIETINKVQADADRGLLLMCQRASEAGVRAQRQSVEGTASDVIIALAKDAGMDLIVMGTHGRTGIKHLLLGSVAEKVIRMASCPVLTVRGSA